MERDGPCDVRHIFLQHEVIRSLRWSEKRVPVLWSQKSLQDIVAFGVGREDISNYFAFYVRVAWIGWLREGCGGGRPRTVRTTGEEVILGRPPHSFGRRPSSPRPGVFVSRVPRAYVPRTRVCRRRPQPSSTPSSDWLPRTLKRRSRWPGSSFVLPAARRWPGQFGLIGFGTSVTSRPYL